MRILIDIHQLEWDPAWEITRKTFSYTNHTLLPEALETWSVALMEKLLPRHLQLIYEINQRFLDEVRHANPGDNDLLRRMSLIEENSRRVRMAHLAVVGSHKVNGVAALHTELMKSTIFADFHRYYPDKIVNKTNGITPRRWLNHCNPLLSELISRHIGDNWVKNLDDLKQLTPLAENSDFVTELQAVKHSNKCRLAQLIKQTLNINANPHSMFDIHVKRIHEYKRQLLNLLHVITLYNRLRDQRCDNFVPRTVIFAGKAAPAYTQAKLIIKLINDVADIINNDPAINDQLKVIFLPNYNVSLAEQIMPACDLSEQISTAGTEASGTGNMKFALNGALTIGTLDGANVEIRDEVGAENIFIFGLTAAEVAQRSGQYNPWDHYHANEELRRVIEMIASGFFSPYQANLYRPIIDSLTSGGDRFMLFADYAAYVRCQETVALLYMNQQEWGRKAVLNIANMGKFSSDRTILEYAREIWQSPPIHIDFGAQKTPEKPE